MVVKKNDKKERQKYFDDTFSFKYLKDEQPEYIEVQVMSENMDIQTEIQRMVLRGITYDPKSDPG